MVRSMSSMELVELFPVHFTKPRVRIQLSVVRLKKCHTIGKRSNLTGVVHYLGRSRKNRRRMAISSRRISGPRS